MIRTGEFFQDKTLLCLFFKIYISYIYFFSGSSEKQRLLDAFYLVNIMNLKMRQVHIHFSHPFINPLSPVFIIPFF